jgi:hypothetical protein
MFDFVVLGFVGDDGEGRGRERGRTPKVAIRYFSRGSQRERPTTQNPFGANAATGGGESKKQRGFNALGPLAAMTLAKVAAAVIGSSPVPATLRCPTRHHSRLISLPFPPPTPRQRHRQGRMAPEPLPPAQPALARASVHSSPIERSASSQQGMGHGTPTPDHLPHSSYLIWINETTGCTVWRKLPVLRPLRQGKTWIYDLSLRRCC